MFKNLIFLKPSAGNTFRPRTASLRRPGLLAALMGLAVRLRLLLCEFADFPPLLREPNLGGAHHAPWDTVTALTGGAYVQCFDGAVPARSLA